MSRLAEAHPRNTPQAWSERASIDTPWGAGGMSEHGQRVRHQVVVDRLAPQPGETLLDYGCGTGQLSERLPADVGYLGFDWAEALVERSAHEHARRVFTTIEPDWPFRLIACIGPFNLPDLWSKAETWETIRRLWAMCTRAMAVSLYAGDDERNIRYFPSELAVTAAALADSFTVERGYLPNDLLMVLRR